VRPVPLTPDPSPSHPPHPSRERGARSRSAVTDRPWWRKGGGALVSLLTLLLVAIAAGLPAPAEAGDSAAAADGSTRWPDGAVAAVSLSYDDSVPVHHQRVEPLLDQHGLRATFYLSARNIDSPEAWKTVAPLLALLACATSPVAQPQGTPPLVIETVPVGNPGNPGEQQMQGTFGAVDYEYSIGKYEVTAGQYAEFLNAVAATDTYALYNAEMWTHAEGCKIQRTGTPGSYTYSVAPDWADRPVNFVSWGDAARFVNWLHNGQPTGVQDLTTTEDGSYFLDGTTNDAQLEDVVREPDATWVIPTEDEWYKAAYHRNDGVTGNYFSYPTGQDAAVSHELIDPDPGNNATFSVPVDDYTIGAPYYRTEVGAHENSASPYGTFDQGGNVQELNETVPSSDVRGVRGGSWFWGSPLLSAEERPVDMHSSDELSDLGFRVANLGGTRQPVPSLSDPAGSIPPELRALPPKTPDPDSG
jgi:formylglycine-generating enzyme required for sulfatase activity